MPLGKVSPRQLKKKELQELERIVLDMAEQLIKEKKPELFLDLLTSSERVMVARRIQAAKMLLLGHSRDQIRKELKIGQTTIENVHDWLTRHFPEYRRIIREVAAKIVKREKQNEPVQVGSFRELRKKYPLHFLLFNLMLDDKDWGRARERYTAEGGYNVITEVIPDPIKKNGRRGARK